jgi:hypothetical protein
MSDKDNFYLKIVDLNESYNCLVLSFSFDDVKVFKTII